MRKLLLTLIIAIGSAIGLQAQTFEWGTASWNIQDGTEFDGIDDLGTQGIVLSFSNPTEFYLTFLNIIAAHHEPQGVGILGNGEDGFTLAGTEHVAIESLTACGLSYETIAPACLLRAVPSQPPPLHCSPLSRRWPWRLRLSEW